MASLIQPRVLKGFRDILPENEIERSGLMEKITKVYRSYGFVPIDTPVLEYSEILLRKSNGETEKQVFRFLDNGNRDVDGASNRHRQVGAKRESDRGIVGFREIQKIGNDRIEFAFHQFRLLPFAFIVEFRHKNVALFGAGDFAFFGAGGFLVARGPIQLVGIHIQKHRAEVGALRIEKLRIFHNVA